MIGGTAYLEVSRMGEASWSDVLIVGAVTVLFFIAVWKVISYFYKK